MLFEESFRLLSYKFLLIAPVEKEALHSTSYAPLKLWNSLRRTNVEDVAAARK